LLSFFFYFSFFNGSEASNICQLSVIVCPFFFWRIFAKRIERLSLITHLIIIIYLINSIENDGFVFKFLLQMWRIFRNIYSTNIRKNENIVLFDRFSVTILTKI